MLFSVFFCISQSYLLDPTPYKFLNNGELNIEVGSLKSSKYTLPLPFNIGDLFCVPSNFYQSTTLYDNMLGDYYGPSTFVYTPNQEKLKCKSTCRKDYTPEQKELLYKLIENHYKIFFYADGIPSRVRYGNSTNSQKYTYGFDIGFKEGKERKRGLDAGLHYMYTHLNLTFYFYRDYALGLNTVVGFEVTPFAPPNKPPCPYEFAESIEYTKSFLFTYYMNHVFVDDKPNQRWENAVENSYVSQIDASLVVYFIIAGISVSIIFFALFFQHIKAEIANQRSESWKDLGSDVFRPPKYSLLWAGFVGSGIHVLCTTIVFLALGQFKVLSPAKPGSNIKVFTIIYIILAPFSGFLNQYMFSATGTASGKFTALKIDGYEVVLPLIYLVMIMIVNSTSGSLEYLALNRMVVLVFILNVALILSLIGSIVCIIFKRFKGAGECAAFPRKMPTQPFYLTHEITETLVGFVVYFISIPILDTLMKYIWVPFGLWKIWGLILGSCISTVAISSAISTCVTYFHLMHEDHEWWWTSFKGPMMSSLFVMMHIMKTFMLKMDSSNKKASIVFVMKSLAFSLVYGICCGAIGTLSSFFLVKRIYKKKN